MSLLSPWLGAARPRLPPAEAILPYLRDIDAARRYSNGGALMVRFEARLAAHFDRGGSPASAVATVSSATTGLTLALRAATGGAAGLCLMPSWTFVATACAVTMAGLTPCFVDVDPATWLLDRTALAAALAQHRAAAVLLVVPGGVAVDLSPWHELALAHRIPLVVNAADGFDSVRPAAVAQVISLHACKAFGIGEGGLVVSTDADLVAKVRRLANFGFGDDRLAREAGCNGKLSEYAAAIGLAALDGWEDSRAAWLAQDRIYRAALHPHGLDLLFPQGWARATAQVDLGGPHARAAEAVLARAGIEARRWWGEGCHRHPAFATAPRGSLAATESLAARVIGLPNHPDLDPAVPVRVAAALALAIKDLK